MTTQPPGSRNSNRLPREGFFALLAEALLERQLRQAMEREGIEALPMYPEGRPCRRPTARRLIDLFEPIQRHELHQPGQPPTTLITELSPLHRRLLRLLGVPATTYGRGLAAAPEIPRQVS